MFAHKSNCFWKLSLSSLSCLLRLPNYMSLPTVWILIQRGRTDSLSGSWLWLSPDASAWKHKKNCFYQVILITTINVCHFAQFKPIQWERTNYYKTWSNISSIRGSVSSPHETLRRQLKIWLQRSIFDELWGVSSGDETLCRNTLVITSHTKWF